MDDNFKVLGDMVCPHDDGDFTLKVKDLHNWSNGMCSIEQNGQGQNHNIVVNKKEAAELAAILIKFVFS